MVHIIFLLYSSVLNYQFFEGKDYITLLLLSTESAIVGRKDITQILTQFNSILGQNTLIIPKFGYTGVNFNCELCVKVQISIQKKQCMQEQLSDTFLQPFILFHLEGHCTHNRCFKEKRNWSIWNQTIALIINILT